MVKRLAVAVIVVGCIPSRRSILADGHRDLAALNRRTDAEVHTLLETFEKETEEASTLLKSQTIYAACSERVPNGATCGLLLEQCRMDLRALQFVHRRCGGVPSDRCNEAYREDYFRALEARYEELPEAHCPDRACDLEALELSLLQTHNDRLTNAFITGGGARRATLKAIFRASLSIQARGRRHRRQDWSPTAKRRAAAASTGRSGSGHAVNRPIHATTLAHGDPPLIPIRGDLGMCERFRVWVRECLREAARSASGSVREGGQRVWDADLSGAARLVHRPRRARVHVFDSMPAQLCLHRRALHEMRRLASDGRSGQPHADRQQSGLVSVAIAVRSSVSAQSASIVSSTRATTLLESRSENPRRRRPRITRSLTATERAEGASA